MMEVPGAGMGTPPKSESELLLQSLVARDGPEALAASLCRACTSADQLDRIHQEVSLHRSTMRETAYFEVPLLRSVAQRFPWLLMLMIVQSVSGFVLQGFEDLIAQHLILAQFLTMLVGGGGNSSGQTVAELVKRLSKAELRWVDTPRILLREIAVGALLALGLGLAAFPRVRLLSKTATSLDALAIAVSYMLIVLMANAVGVGVVMVLNRCGLAAVGAPPVVQVIVDVLGITLTCLVSTVILGVGPALAPSCP